MIGRVVEEVLAGAQADTVRHVSHLERKGTVIVATLFHDLPQDASALINGMTSTFTFYSIRDFFDTESQRTIVVVGIAVKL